MSGAEAAAVLGVISSIISIVEGTKKVYDAATNAKGLPEAFREVAGRLPIVENILGSTKQYINYDSCKGAKHVAEACKKKAQKLDEMFHKAIPAEGASDLKRYYKAVKACGKGSEVENLMKGMLEDVQLLACERGMKSATQAQQEQIITAIAEVSAVSPSVGPNEDEVQCLSALFLTDISADRETLITTKGPRVDGTCEWIRGHALYKSWLGSQSQLLWLSGGPGKGKTMLSIFLAEELEGVARLSQNKLFLQYFCDNKDEKRNTAVAILRGLIFQLLQSRPKLFDHILPIFKIQKESLFLSTSFETLWRIFESMVCDPALETTYCVLDGLDECDEASLEILLGKFAALLSAKPYKPVACHLNLLIVSRDFPDAIPELLRSFPRVSLDPDADTEINKDIDLFIKAKVSELSRRKQYPERLRVHVEEVFRHRAHGTFLWIGIVAQALGKYKATEVEKALGLFPRGLDQLYARILLQIDSDRREIAARILRWVVMAVRPLTLSELSIAMEDTFESSRLTPNEIIRDQVLYCGNILVIEKVLYCGNVLVIEKVDKKDEVDKEDEVGLIHQSAKDYLLRKTPNSDPKLEFFRVKEEVANLEIASKCLDYLESGALEDYLESVALENRECEPKQLLRNLGHLRNFPLLSYAVLHWHEHARSLAHSANVFDLSRPFYHEKSQIRTSWLKAYWKHEEIFDVDGDDRGPPTSFTPLHLASYLGILPLAKKLVLTKHWTNETERLDYLNEVDGNGTTALMWAAKGGHEAVVQLLLENRADIEAKDKDGCTALIVAAEHGHGAVVQLLLEKRANIEVKNKFEHTALLLAAKKGHETVSRLLLKKGADIEGKGKYGTPLIRAAESGHERVVRLLLEKGADIEARNNDGKTALMEAAVYRHESILRLLLKRGADINVKDFAGDTALIRTHHESVSRLLLKMGADIETKNKHGETALMRAARDGDKALVQLLLEKGANIGAKDERGETSLMKAAESGHEEVVSLLLEKGVDINATDKNGKTALMTAAEYGRETIAQLLLEKGADIEANHGHTALFVSAEGGCAAVVQLSLEKGVDINATNKNGETSLMKAAESGHEEVVSLLLEKGVDINATNKNGETSLMKAAESGHEEVVSLLLRKGADFNVKNKNEETALIRAARFGHEAVLKRLVWRGADINAKDKFGDPVLGIAARSGCYLTPSVLEQQRATIANFRMNIERRKAEEKEKRCDPWRKSRYKVVRRLLTPHLES